MSGTSIIAQIFVTLNTFKIPLTNNQKRYNNSVKLLLVLSIFTIPKIFLNSLPFIESLSREHVSMRMPQLSILQCMHYRFSVIWRRTKNLHQTKLKFPRGGKRETGTVSKACS